MSLKLQQKKAKNNQIRRANGLHFNGWYYCIILWVGGRQKVALPRAATCLEPGLLGRLSNHIISLVIMAVVCPIKKQVSVVRPIPEVMRVNTNVGGDETLYPQ